MSPERKQTIIQHEAKLIAAMQAADVDALDQLIHNDLIFSVPSGKSVTKEMDLRAYRSGKMVVEVLDESEQEIVDYESCVAVSVVVQLSGHYDGTIFDGAFRFLRVWKEASGRWQVITGGSHHLAPT